MNAPPRRILVENDALTRLPSSGRRGEEGYYSSPTLTHRYLTTVVTGHPRVLMFPSPPPSFSSLTLPPSLPPPILSARSSKKDTPPTPSPPTHVTIFTHFMMQHVDSSIFGTMNAENVFSPACSSHEGMFGPDGVLYPLTPLASSIALLTRARSLSIIGNLQKQYKFQRNANRENISLKRFDVVANMRKKMEDSNRIPTTATSTEDSTAGKKVTLSKKAQKSVTLQALRNEAVEVRSNNEALEKLVAGIQRMLVSKTPAATTKTLKAIGKNGGIAVTTWFESGANSNLLAERFMGAVRTKCSQDSESEGEEDEGGEGGEGGEDDEEKSQNKRARTVD